MSARIGHRILGFALVLAGASADAQERGLPARAPGWSPYDLAGEVAEAFRVVPTREQRGRTVGGSYRGDVLEVYAGERELRSEVLLEWDPGGGAQIERQDAARGWERGALALLDGEGRLLLLSERDPASLASAVGTSRRESARFSERELRWAWFATRSGAWAPLARHLHAALRAGEEAPPRLLELALRFGGPELSCPLLHALADGRRLSPAALDAVRVSLWDLAPTVQARALHLLLDHGVELDAESAAHLRRSPRLDHLPLAGALARMGEPRALALLAAKLVEYAPPLRTIPTLVAELLEQTAWGDASLLPLVRPYLDAGADGAALAWLALGGAPDAVDEELRYWLHGEGPYRLPPEDYRPALAVFLARRDGKGMLTYEAWSRIQAIAEEASALSAERSAEVRAELRAALPALSAPEQGRLATWLLRLGDAGVLGEVERILRHDALNALQQTWFAAALAEDGSPRALQLLVDVLVAVLADPPSGHCASGEEQILAACVEALARLPERARPHVLALLEARLATTFVDGAPLLERLERRGHSSPELAQLRSNLDHVPTRDELRSLDRLAYDERFELALAAAGRAELLHELRLDPRDLSRLAAACAQAGDDRARPAWALLLALTRG